MTSESGGGGDGFQDAHRKRSAEEIAQLTASIMERARRSVDPHDKGFEPTMSFSTWNWWEDFERLVFPILLAFLAVSNRFCYAFVAAGFAIGSGIMFGSEAGSRYAGLALIIAVLFAAAVAVTSFMEVSKSR